jgi:glyoxylase-like metal-dependent hydrolase (beta-lactamase superfamily II)
MLAQDTGKVGKEQSLSVEMLNAGWMTAAAGLWRREDEEPEKMVRLPVPVYLVEAGGERILIDTGLHPGAAAGRYEDRPTMAFFGFEQGKSLAEQVDLGSLTMVVLTHLHFDHAGGLTSIPASVPIVLQRAEWEAGQDQGAIERNFYIPGDYAGIESELVLVDGDHDLLGDGSVELLSTPGHTPGHQSVRIGDLVLGADVAYFATGLDDHRFPAFADDREEQARSAERLRGLREDGLTVRPGHDPEVLRPGPVTS